MNRDSAGTACAYGFHAPLKPMDFADAVTRVIDALETQGFGMLTDIDVQATMKSKLGINARPYRILGASNPPLGHRALEADPDIGLLLPCNVTVREESDTSIFLGFMQPVVARMTDDPKVAAVAQKVRQRPDRVCQRLAE